MVNKNIKVKINGKSCEYPVNTTLLEISRDFRKDYSNDIILAFMNNKLRELFKCAEDNSKISFVTTGDDAGN
jgi:uridine kinase